MRGPESLGRQPCQTNSHSWGRAGRKQGAALAEGKPSSRGFGQCDSGQSLSLHWGEGRARNPAHIPAPLSPHCPLLPSLLSDPHMLQDPFQLEASALAAPSSPGAPHAPAVAAASSASSVPMSCPRQAFPSHPAFLQPSSSPPRDRNSHLVVCLLSPAQPLQCELWDGRNLVLRVRCTTPGPRTALSTQQVLNKCRMNE